MAMERIYNYLLVVGKKWSPTILMMFVATAAHAQFSNGAAGVTQDYVDTAVANLANAMPQPATTVPPAEQVGGAAGAAQTYRRSDAVQPRITRTVSTALDVNGNATFDFTSQGALTGPVQVLVTPVGTTPLSCTRTAPTQAGNTGSISTVSVHCTSGGAISLTAAILTAVTLSAQALNPFSNAPTSTPVDIVVFPKS